MKPKILLASASPRRRELVSRLGVPFEVFAADCDETVSGSHSPDEYVKILALRKARAAMAKYLERPKSNPSGATVYTSVEPPIVIGSDTVVALDGEILGKPRDRDDAINTLLRLSGRAHRVCTGLAVIDGEREIVTSGSADVYFTNLTKADCISYADTGEPLDKAGSYGIQGIGGALVERIDGDYYSIVGLPLAQLKKILETEFDVKLWQEKN